MSLTKDNLDSVSKLLTALSQRHTVIQDLAGRLSSDVAWRSPDGQLAIQLSEAERQQLEDFVRLYAQEVELVLLALKAHLGDKERPAAHAL